MISLSSKVADPSDRCDRQHDRCLTLRHRRFRQRNAFPEEWIFVEVSSGLPRRQASAAMSRHIGCKLRIAVVTPGW